MQIVHVKSLIVINYYGLSSLVEPDKVRLMAYK
jgi:hypothetical protein